MMYRREVDGLRTIAILPVILYHAGYSLFSGGFVGVDVFFIISGYLITSILIAELGANNFSILNFYERRARRILPALFFVMLVCLPFAWLWLLPNDLKRFSLSLATVSLFSSNILFWRESGYFDAAAEIKPLLHTWSLAVEEQYYLFFPVLLMATWRWGRRWVLSILALIFIVSIALACWGSEARPIAAFFLLPTRGWELLIGSFCAFYLHNRPLQVSTSPVREAAAGAGLLLILYSVFFFDHKIPFPSAYTLVPTLGAALIILFATRDTLTGKLLGTKLFVGIGLISYSAYLWHQPLFAFARNESTGEPSHFLMSTLALASLLLAFVSWKYVEAPFRQKGRVSRKGIAYFSALGTFFFCSIGVIGALADGFKERLAPNIKWESLEVSLNKRGDICSPLPLSGYKGILGCTFGDVGSKKTLILYGDSHAQAISRELDKALSSARTRGIWIQLEGCDIIPGIRDVKEIKKGNSKCVEKFISLLEFVKKENADVLAISRWTYRLSPIPGVIDQLGTKNSEGGIESISFQEFAIDDATMSFGISEKKAAMDTFMTGLLSTGRRIIVVYPIPEISWNIAKINTRFYHKTGSALERISIPHADFTARHKFVYSVLDRFVGNENFVPIIPEKIFCNTFLTERCTAQFGTVPFYYDDDHLSDEGAQLVVKKIVPFL